jgi:exopolyphosphatase/guanosine-5'-triphosphate,3'-diphosphate pyrophosphatase
MGYGNAPKGFITKPALKAMKHDLLRYEHTSQIPVPGLKDDRRIVWPGGLAIMLAVFEELVKQAGLIAGVDVVFRSDRDGPIA